MQMRQRDVAALDAKCRRVGFDAKLKMMLCVMMLPLVVVGYIRLDLSVSAWATTASGVDNAAPPPDCEPTPLNRIISPPQREAESLCKNNWKEPRGSILMSSANGVAHIDGQLAQLL